MDSTYKAECRCIQLGDTTLNLYRMPNGDYCASQIEVARVIKKFEDSVRFFKRSQRAKDLWSNSLQASPLPVKEFNKPIVPVPLEFAALYWQYWDAKGNLYARALVNALLKRSLKDLADEVFAEETTAAERNAELEINLSSAGVDRVAAMQAQLEREEGQVRDDRRFNQQFLLQMQQLVLQVQNLQTQINKLQSQAQLTPNKISTFITVESSGQVSRESGITHYQLRKELGIDDPEELNRLLADTSFGINSGYWHLTRAIAPLLPFEYYPTVKALLIERQGRKLEFEG